jgi:asparagine synthase (glutamine-hydrolysing)
MCGISGFFSQSNMSKERVAKLRDGIRERGSDNFGEVLNFDPHTIQSAFYHARLSIIDVGATSNQPYGKAQYKQKLVYNGEVYNFRELRDVLISRFNIKFETDGDTEVVFEGLRCMGKDFIPMISGEFAFCFYDCNSSSLLLARDVFGKKPVSFVSKEDSFLFSSSEKSLGDLTFGLSQFNSFCAIGYIPERMPLFSDVTVLDPGWIVEVDLCTLRSEVSQFKVNTPLQNTVRRSVTESVNRQMTADVPVGIFLSGGFDSTLVASIAAQTTPDLHAFSFVSDDYHSEESLIDEWVKEKGIGFKVNKLSSSEINVPDELMSILPKLYRPTADSSIIPTNALSRLAHDNGVKVVLSGLGGDEMFCGYNRYAKRKFISKFDFSAYHAIAAFFRCFQLYRLSNRGLDLAVSSFLQTTQFNSLSGGDKIKVCAELDVFLRKGSSKGGLKDLMDSDLNNYTVDLLHRQYDIISLLHDVEIRSPLLAAGIHSSMSYIADDQLLAGGRLKNIQKDVFKNYFTSQQLNAKKQGFSGPINDWVEKYRDFFDFHSNHGYVNDNFGVKPLTIKDKWVYSCINIWLSQF